MLLPCHQLKFYTLSLQKNTWHKLTVVVHRPPSILDLHTCVTLALTVGTTFGEALDSEYFKTNERTTENLLLICLHYCSFARATKICLFVFDLTESSHNFPVFLDWHSLSKNLSSTTRLMHQLKLTEREREEMGLRRSVARKRLGWKCGEGGRVERLRGK